MKGIWGFNIKNMKNLSNLLDSRTEKRREKKERRTGADEAERKGDRERKTGL